METIQRTELEQVQEQTPEVGVDVDVKGDRGIGGGAELQSALGEMADGFDVRGFKCVHEQCGLVHGHDTTKHRTTHSFGMGDDEAASGEANPNCHCGLNEAARKGVPGAPSPSNANSTAPIPDSMTRHLDRTV